MKTFATLAALGAAVAPTWAGIIPRDQGSLPPVTVKGNAFFAGNDRFYIRGVAYQPGGAADAKDPLVDITSLKRDIENFKKLGINTVRIYTIDNSQNHDEGMKLLDDAGIYLALDTNTPKYSLNNKDEASLHASYNDVYLQSIFATVDAFAGYSNLLLFFSGNEVINAKNNTGSATYIKAVTRDLKQYVSNHASRKIPVGYSSADVAENIEQQANFFNCGSDDERADFFAFNDYSWCDPSDFKKSGWDAKVKKYASYSIPLFLSEFGCNTNTREWNELSALYSDKMSSVYSGGLAYEYTAEPNGYGLIQNNDGNIEPNDDFGRLTKAYDKTKNFKGDGGYKTNGSPSKCPPQDDEWQVKGTLLPSIPKKAVDLMNKGAGKGPGLEGDGSQWAGTPSESTASPGSGNPSKTPGSAGSKSAGNLSLDIPAKFLGMMAASVLLGMALLI